VIYEIDLAGKFSGSQVFVKQLESAVHHFYKEAGQRLKPWVPSPPKVSLENEEYIEPPKVGTKEEAKEESWALGSLFFPSFAGFGAIYFNLE